MHPPTPTLTHVPQTHTLVLSHTVWVVPHTMWVSEHLSWSKGLGRMVRTPSWWRGNWVRRKGNQWVCIHYSQDTHCWTIIAWELWTLPSLKHMHTSYLATTLLSAHTLYLHQWIQNCLSHSTQVASSITALPCNWFGGGQPWVVWMSLPPTGKEWKLNKAIKWFKYTLHTAFTHEPSQTYLLIRTCVQKQTTSISTHPYKHHTTPPTNTHTHLDAVLQCVGGTIHQMG